MFLTKEHLQLNCFSDHRHHFDSPLREKNQLENEEEICINVLCIYTSIHLYKIPIYYN